MTAVLATALQVVLLLAALVALPALRAGLRREPWDGPALALRRSWRKGTVVPAGCSALWGAVPAASLSLAAVAALLVPVATLGGVLGPAADLLLVAGLLAASRALPALAGFDAGVAPLAFAGLTGLRERLGALPVLLLTAMAVLLLSGGTNLEGAALAIRDGGTAAHGAGALAGLAVLAAGAGAPGSPEPWTGRGRALLLLAGEVRLLAVLLLGAALLCPWGLAAAPDGWLPGILAAAVKLLVLGGASALPSVPLPTTSPVALPCGAALAVGAVVLAGLAVAA